MYNKLFYIIFTYQIKAARKFGGAPFVWDARRGELRVTNHSKIRFYTYCGILYLRIAYLGPRLVNISSHESLAQICLLTVVFIVALFDCNSSLFFIPTPENSAAVINAYLRFGNEFTGNL